MATYSDINPAWGRVQAQRENDQRERELWLAKEIMRDEPGTSRSEALRRAYVSLRLQAY